MLKSRTLTSAFSLVETALAVGVVAFAFVGLLALLPMGLTNFRDSVDTSIGAQIFQRIVTDAEQTDFDLLTGVARAGTGEFFLLPTRFFDDQGTEVVLQRAGAPSSFESQQIVYHVLIRGSRPGPDAIPASGSALFTSLPSTAPGKRFSPRDATFLTVQIAHRPGGQALPLDENLLWDSADRRSATASIVTYSAVITRNGFPRKTAP